MKKRASVVVFAFFFLPSFVGSSAAIDLPSPQGYVSDYAGVIEASRKAGIESLLSQVRSQTGIEMAVVTVTSLQGLQVDDYANQLFRKWGIGGKKENNGLLILVAPNERKWRVEVGYGLEGELPDGFVGEVGRQMVPYFRAQNYGGGLYVAAQNIVTAIAEKRGITIEGLNRPLPPAPSRAQRPRRSSGALPVSLLIFFFFLFIFVIGIVARFRAFRHGYRRRFRYGVGSEWFLYPIIFGGGGSGGFGGHSGGGSHDWGSFGGGGGGSGFGGFGGGSSGGGGASGDW
jgi:uncharacterized protein